MSEALIAAASSVATDAMSAITGILPIALPVMGAFVIIRAGIRVLKMATK